MIYDLKKNGSVNLASVAVSDRNLGRPKNQWNKSNLSNGLVTHQNFQILKFTQNNFVLDSSVRKWQ